MAGVKHYRIAVLWRGDHEARRAATPQNNRYHRVFEELAALAIHAEQRSRPLFFEIASNAPPPRDIISKRCRCSPISVERCPLEKRDGAFLMHQRRSLRSKPASGLPAARRSPTMSN